MEKKQVIELYENKDQVKCAAIDRIVVEIFNKKNTINKSQSILFSGCSPLAGTTTTCIGLSIALANAKWKTILVDCDLRKSMKYKKLNEQTSIGLSDYLIKNASVSDITYNTNIENLAYVPCGNYTENSTRMLCSQKMKQLVESLKDQYDYVIFDFPALTVAPDAQIMFSDVDGIVLIAATGETTKSQVKEANRKVSKYNDKYFGMIVNKLDFHLFKSNVRNYDYYLLNNKGEQNLSGSAAKKYKKKEGKE